MNASPQLPEVAQDAEAVKVKSVFLQDFDLDSLGYYKYQAPVMDLVEHLTGIFNDRLAKDAERAGLRLPRIRARDAFDKYYATETGLEARLFVLGAHGVALEWLNCFGWCVVDECQNQQEEAAWADISALRALSDMWNPDVRSGCCKGGSN